jgi:Fe-S-cluster containining protein
MLPEHVSDEKKPAQIVGQGPAARARAEGRAYNLRILKSAMTPFANADGTLRAGSFAPYSPVLHACDLCPARCCRLNVKISLADAIHYCRTLGLPFFAGMTIVPSTHEAHAFRVQRDPRVIPASDGWIGTGEIQLKRKDDGSCHALVSIGGYERCGVYSARPSLCRLYPFSWTSDVAKGSPGMILCPVPYGITEADEQQFLRDVERSIENWELHDDVVAEWHALDLPEEERTIEAFLLFAVPRTAEVLGVSYDGILARGAPHERLYESMVKSGVVRPPQPRPAVTPPARTPETSD